MKDEMIDDLRQGVDVLVRVLKVTDAIQVQKGKSVTLNSSESQTLTYIAERSGCIAREIAQYLNISPTTISSIIDRLVRAQLILRERTEHNRRIIILKPTQRGKNLAHKVVSQQQQHCKTMLQALPVDEQQQFVDAIRAIADHIT